MSDKPLTRGRKIALGIVIASSAGVVILMGALGAKIRRERLEAKRGIGPSTTLHAGDKKRLAHFTVSRDAPGALSVFDSSGRLCVTFTALKAGDIRRWQELQLAFSRVDDRSLDLDHDLVPGSPCYGPGLYHAPRPGLRIDLPGGRSVVVLQPLKVRVEGDGKTEEVVLTEGEEKTVLSTRLRFARGAMELR